MSALVVDTSSWISYFAGSGRPADAVLIDDALKEGRLHLPPIVAAELLSGRMSARQRKELEDLLDDLPLCISDLTHWLRVGRLRADLAAKGIAVSTPDAHIAQCALDLGADLLTEDEIFQHVAKHYSLRIP